MYHFLNKEVITLCIINLRTNVFGSVCQLNNVEIDLENAKAITKQQVNEYSNNLYKEQKVSILIIYAKHWQCMNNRKHL